MPEARDLALVRNAIAILRSLDWHEVGELTSREWETFRDDPHRMFLAMRPDARDVVWAAVQRRLPTELREGVAA